VARIAVVTSSPPFVEGGHLVIARALVRALNESGHQGDLVVTASNRFSRQPSSYMANWLTDVGVTGSGEPIDQVISLRFPSYAVRHERHACWLNHPMREYYDLWENFERQLSTRGLIKERFRRAVIRRVDTYLFKNNVTKLFAQSKTIQDRLTRFNGVASEVVYPPAPHRDYRCEGYGDFILVYSRLAPLKRIELVVRALATPEAAGVRCVIVGDGEEGPRLKQLAKDLGVEARAQFVGRVSDEELTKYLAACRAVCFVPLDEDFGMVTVEAFASSKAVVTATDSGAPVELVQSGATGYVVSPEPAAIGRALAELMSDASLAERLGQGAAARAATLTWAKTVERLVLPQ
jgi:glycosyltransferase involved in cell wall biosynthesis